LDAGESFGAAGFSTLIVATLFSVAGAFATAGFSFGAAGLSDFSFVVSAFAVFFDASSVTAGDFSFDAVFSVFTGAASVFGAFGLAVSLLGADSFAGLESASVTGSARRTTSFGFGGWTGIALSSRGTKISWP
jgi:hypothetical protein